MTARCSLSVRGTITDDFDPERHVFHNFTFDEIYQDFLALRCFL